MTRPTPELAAQATAPADDIPPAITPPAAVHAPAQTAGHPSPDVAPRQLSLFEADI